MNPTKGIKIKKDKYKSARGGYSRILNIHCRKCENLVAVYQKDGPGNLRRMYLDRIFSPESICRLEHCEIKEIKPLICSKCKELLGIPYVYVKEKRKAFKIFQDAVIKRIRKTNEQKFN